MNARPISLTKQGFKLARAPKCPVVIVALWLIAISGCQPLMSKKSMIPWGSKNKDAKVIPDRILAVWTDTVLHQQGQTGVRGFGGRIYFYEKDKTDPIEVEGSLAVYAFDAEDDAVDSQKPLRKFVFTPEQLAGHMSKTSIGPSYSIWLPWSAVGDPPQKLSLITRFEGVDGGTTISDPVIKLLPGIVKKADSEKTSNSPALNKSSAQKSVDMGVQPASYSEPKESEPNKRMESRPVETIELPPGFQRHLKNTERLQKGINLDGEPQPASQPEITTQVFDAKNPFPQSEKTSPSGDYNTEPTGEQPRLFSSSRPDRSNIRNGSWLKPERRLQDGIERKQNR